MKEQLATDVNVRWQYSDEAGFSLLAAIVFVFFLALVASVFMNLMRVRWAFLAFLVAVILALLIASLPDIKRYVKISGM